MAHEKQRRSNLTEYGKYAGLGIQFAVTFMVFGALGFWLDSLWGTRPLFLLAGVFLGATGAFIWLIRQIPVSRPRSAVRSGEPPKTGEDATREDPD